MLRSLPRARLALLMLGAPLLASIASGCVQHHHYDAQVYRWEPPPRAPAHGYRHHYRGITLVFDRSLDCYVVHGHPDHYFYLGHYYRFHDGRWQRGTRLQGTWRLVDADTLSSGLRHRHVTRERHEAVKEHRDERHQAVKHHRDEHRQAVKEHRDERRQTVKEHRDERRQDAKEHRGERREAVKEHRDERREAVEERNDEHGRTAKEHRDDGHPPGPASHR